MKQKRPQTKPIPVRLDKALLKRIKKAARAWGEPESTIMRMAMRAGLIELERAVKANPPSGQFGQIAWLEGEAREKDKPKLNEKKTDS